MLKNELLNPPSYTRRIGLPVNRLISDSFFARASCHVTHSAHKEGSSPGFHLWILLSLRLMLCGDVSVSKEAAG